MASFSNTRVVPGIQQISFNSFVINAFTGHHSIWAYLKQFLSKNFNNFTHTFNNRKTGFVRLRIQFQDVRSVGLVFVLPLHILFLLALVFLILLLIEPWKTESYAALRVSFPGFNLTYEQSHN